MWRRPQESVQQVPYAFQICFLYLSLSSFRESTQNCLKMSCSCTTSNNLKFESFPFRYSRYTLATVQLHLIVFKQFTLISSVALLNGHLLTAIFVLNDETESYAQCLMHPLKAFSQTVYQQISGRYILFQPCGIL